MTCSRAVDRSQALTGHFAGHLPQRGADGGVMRSHMLPSGRPLARAYGTVRGALTAARHRRRGDALARAPERSTAREVIPNRSRRTYRSKAQTAG